MSHGYGGSGHGQVAPGWHPDPWQRVPLRWWDGAQWTPWESDGGAVWSARDAAAGRSSEPMSVRVGPEHLESLRFVEDVFLSEARRRGVVGEPQLASLTDLSRRLAAEARGEVPDEGAVRGEAPRDAAPTVSPFVSPSVGYAPVPQPGYGPSEQPGYAAVPQPAYAVSAQPGPGSPSPSPAPSPAPTTPGRFARWWAQVRERSDADLTVHGLAYLGVLLLFVGVFGLVAFAFSDVSPELRPVAELAVAAVPFVGAWLLARSGAKFVARTLVAVGGLLLPVMVVTSLVDGFGVPPDAHGVALPAVSGPLIGALAVAYGWWTVRRPGSGLGVMVAPVLWFAAGMAATGLGRPVPRGEDVAVPGGAQVAVIALALLATTLVARRVPARVPRAAEVATSALAAVGPGVVVVGTLALVAAVAEGWPVLPVVVTVLGLGAAVVVCGRFGPTTTQVTVVVGWAVVAVLLLAAGERTPLLSPDVPVAGAMEAARPWLLLGVVLLGVGLVEVLLRRFREGTAALLLLAGVVLVVTVHVAAGHWWTVVAAGGLAVWAGWRRAAVPGGSRSALGFDVVAAVAPALLVAGVWGSASGAVALLVAAALVLAAVPLARGWLARSGAVVRKDVPAGDGVPALDDGPVVDGVDPFWRRWSAVSVPVVLVGSMGQLAVSHDVGGTGMATGTGLATGSVPIAAALVGAAVVLGPWRAAPIVAAVTPIGWWAWLTACLAFGAPTAVGPVGLAVAALVAIVVSHSVRRADVRRGAVPRDGDSAERRDFSVAGAVGVAGHVTGVVAVLVTLGVGLELVVALAGFTVGWFVTAVLGDRGRSPVGELFDRAGAVGRFGPWVMVLGGAPLTVAAGGHVSGLLTVDDPWWPATFVVAGLLYAALTRAVRTGRLVRLLPVAAFTGAVLGVLLPWSTWPRVVALGALVVQVLLTRGRGRVMVWTAWAALTPLVVLTVRDLVPATRDLGEATVLALTLIGLGGLLAVGALVGDRALPADRALPVDRALLGDRARPGEPRWLPRRPGALAPVVLGAVQLLLGVAAAGLVPDASRAGVLLAAAAVLIAAVAGLSGIGGVGAFAVLLGWVAAFPLLGADHPGAWAHVAVVVVMLVAAQGASMLQGRAREGSASGDLASGDPTSADPESAAPASADFVSAGSARPGWSRWDVPLLIAAAVPALAAIATVAGPDRPVVLVVVGALVVAVAVRLRRRAVLSEVLGGVGTLLVLSGAAGSPGWTAMAFALLAAVHTALAALRESGTARTARQWVGALAVVPAWFAMLVAVVPGAQMASELTALVGGLLVLVLVAVAAAGRVDRSWLPPWGAVGVGVALAGLLRLAPHPGEAARRWGDETLWTGADVWTAVAASWWHAAAWLVLAAAAVLSTRALRWTWGREVGVLGVLASMVTVFDVVDVTTSARVVVEVVLSVSAAVAMVLVGRAASTWLRPLTVLGVGAVVLAAVGAGAVAADAWITGAARTGTADPGTVGPLLVAGVLAAIAVQVAAAGVAWRVLGLRLAAPVVAWGAWAVYAANALGGVVAWYTVPVGLALLVVVAVWRADRRDRGLAPVEGGVVGLELTGIAFLVVASFAAAFTTSVLHALVAAGIGVLVTLWGLLTRVRRRLFTGVGIVLVGVVLAVGLPLVALLPAWGEAGAWVLVAVVGVLAVLAATLIERGRTAVRDGRARLRDATAGWE